MVSWRLVPLQHLRDHLREMALGYANNQQPECTDGGDQKVRGTRAKSGCRETDFRVLKKGSRYVWRLWKEEWLQERWGA